MKTKLTAKAVRIEKWWVVEVEELGGFFTQAKRLGQVEMMVKDAAALLTQQPEDTFEVIVIPQLPEPEEKMLKEARKVRAGYEKVTKDFQEKSKKVIDALAFQGMSLRDIGDLVGLSFQRVSAIRNATQNKKSSIEDGTASSASKAPGMRKDKGGFKKNDFKKAA